MGAALVAGACAWVGFRQARVLKMRVRAMKELEGGLALLEQMLELGGPLPRLLRDLSDRSSGPAKGLFSHCADELARPDRGDFPTLWRQAVERTAEIGPEVRDCLLPLGETLGQCELRYQRQAVAAARSRLDHLALQAETEYRQQGKVYRVLGVSGGAFLTILLL